MKAPCPKKRKRREILAEKRKRREGELNPKEQIDIPGVHVVQVLWACPPRPTLLVSDEKSKDGKRVRRLRFFQPDDGDDAAVVSDHVQTEMMLHRNNDVDCCCLRQPYHSLMVAALSCPAEPSPLRGRRALMLGHGAGALSSFLKHVLCAEVTAVDSDAAVVAVGQQHFGDFANVHVCDAVDFVLLLNEKKGRKEREDKIKHGKKEKEEKIHTSFDAVFVDINAVLEPLAAPPASMYSTRVVRALAACTPLVVVNVLEGCKADRRRVASAFAAHFQHVLWLRSPLCTNHILVAGHTLVTPSQRHLDKWIVNQHKPRLLARALEEMKFDVSVRCELHPQGLEGGKSSRRCDLHPQQCSAGGGECWETGKNSAGRSRRRGAAEEEGMRTCGARRPPGPLIPSLAWETERKGGAKEGRHRVSSMS
jgi:hypothetical protein